MMADPDDPDTEERPIPDPEQDNDVADESGAGYGNHGDADQVD
ncbi:hypothetical protein [Sphingomonas liriopis]|nr:hypothetical protein [Sphingomonas liriopis]